MTTRHILTSEEMEQLGRDIASHLGPGDVVILHGPLGAGKTTLSRGVGEGLGVEGTIQSPTFVLARTHPRQHPELPPLVHVDAYRLSHADELIDLDLDYENSIVLIEWGRPYVEQVAEDWLDIDIATAQSLSDNDDEFVDNRQRVVTITAHSRSGQSSVHLRSLLEALNDSGD